MSMRWDDAPNSSRESARALDPYFLWAQHTQFRGMALQGGWQDQTTADELVQIIARADNDEALAAALQHPVLQIPPAYAAFIPGTQKRALHFTAWLKRSQFAELRDAQLAISWELSQPRRDAERVARASGAGYFGSTRPGSDMTAPNVLGPAIAQAASQINTATARPLLHHVVAVIDFGCPFLNTRYATNQAHAATRVAALWDQGSQAQPANVDARHGAPAWPWHCPAQLAYGREITAPLLQAMSSAAAGLDESDAYRGIDYLIDYDDPRRRIWLATHGAHVLDVAGGTADPVSGQGGDAASHAALVFVQLPSLTASDSSGASMASHLLDGVRYVLAQCSADAKIVITISYGSHAGPHNGTALIESALDELLQAREKNFAIVLASGNSRHKQCHAKRQVTPTRSARLRCAIAGGDTTDTFVETWYQRPPKGWALKARVRGPNRSWSPWVGPEQEVLLHDWASGNEVVAMWRNDPVVPNGDGLGLLLLALAPTAQPAGVACALAPAGGWEMEYALCATAAQSDGPAPQIELAARIERDDPGQNAGSGWHVFVDQDFDDELDCLSSIATGRHTVAVGGFRLSDRQQTVYTSVGPQRGADQALPLVLVACEEDDVHPTIRAAAVRSSEVHRMNGTSVAAPALARQLFNHMAQHPVARDGWRQVLDQLASQPGGVVRWPDA